MEHKNYHFPDPDRYIKELTKLDTNQIRKLISRNGKNNYPIALYKFRPIDNSKLRPFLLENELYLSSRKQFNDPFDATVLPVIPDSGIRRREWAKSVAKNVGATYKQRKEFIAKMHDAKVAKERILKGIETHLDSAGVFSFAGDPRDILMWSHYADSHRGVCLRFEIALDVETFLHALPVRYSDDYPVVEWMTANDGKNLINDVLLKKANHWSYEQERRFVLPEVAGRLMCYKPSALTHVIYGCNTTDAGRKEVRAMLDQREKAGHGRPIEWYAHQSPQHFTLGIFGTPTPPANWRGRPIGSAR